MSNWFGYGRRPAAAEPTPSESGTIRRGIYGEQGVRFNDNGRLVYPGQQAPKQRERPANMLFFPPQTGAMGPTNFRYRPWTRAALPPQAPVNTRRVDQNAGLLERRSYEEKQTAITTMGSETIVIEEMKIYEEKPPYWPLFLFAGFMLIGIAIANIILCLDYHAFFFIWSGVLVIIFSIMCIIHGGDYYDSKWKSFLLIIIGFITNVFILAALFLVIKTFTYQCIEIIQFRPDFYITILTFRYQYLNQTPIVTINNEFAYNAWVCFGIDGLGIIFLFVCLGTLTTTLFVIDRFYNSHYVINRKIEPGCEPKLFNPYSQCNLGQVILVVGMVVTGLDDGVSDNASFFYKYPLIWTGAVPIVAGLFAAITLKNCSITHRVVAIIAIILELISLLSSIAAAILTALVIVENITTLIATSFKLVTLFSVNLILSSAILETASLIVVVINVIYSLSLLFRIVACICTKWYHTDENEEKKLVTEDGSSNVSSTVIVDKTPAAVQPAAAQSSNEFARFDPYRSYYVK